MSIVDEGFLRSIVGGGLVASAVPSSAFPALPSSAPTDINISDSVEIHSNDAYTALLLNVTLIVCILLGYYIKVNRIYYLPESGAAMLVGVFIGGMARIWLDDLTLFFLDPEFFFFVLLPPIIFEAGYSLKRKNFFDNIGAITLYAMFGTVISTFVVGYLTLYLSRAGLISGTDKDNPMEALLFGALISAVDPVATLSILGSPELQCDQLLYSLVFGESVLNDAIAIVLFKTFLSHYNPDDPLDESALPLLLLSFCVVTFFSILVGIALGLLVSFIYRHSSLKKFPKLETALLFLFCYLCYATAEAVELSGIMALFFMGIILSHYNSYNLSQTAHVTSDQIFATLAVITETICFLYMGMGVFTGKFNNFNILFTVAATCFCALGRALNIFPLSFLANCCRRRGLNHIPLKMQGVLWFAGLRGAIAFALSENMPGPNKDTYATATLFICMFTTLVCGGFTEKVLSYTGMRQDSEIDDSNAIEHTIYDQLIPEDTPVYRITSSVQQGVKGAWKIADDTYLKPLFGGSENRVTRSNSHMSYELGQSEESKCDDDDCIEHI